MRTGCNLGEHRHQAANQIEDQIPATAHGVFDFRTKRPQENHVPDDVRPAAVHEHRGQNRDPVMTRNNLRRNGGPGHNEDIAACQFEQEDKDIDQND